MRTAWDLLNRHGNVNPSWLAAAATARWLTTLERRDLALRFLCWATHIDADLNALPMFEEELAHFDLPTAVDGSPELLDQLLDELDLM